jgi:hypothetical protein
MFFKPFAPGKRPFSMLFFVNAGGAFKETKNKKQENTSSFS